MHTEGHDMGKDNLGNTPPVSQGPKIDAEHPGYELQDVNASGVAVFLAGLFGVVIIFFFFCYGMGKVINNLWEKQDGKATKWTIAANAVPAGKGEDLKSNAAIEQEQLQQMTSTFPTPRLEMDDGNQDTADLHAREDLLLEHYSTVDGQPGTIRIPIERAMELIAQRGLPVNQAPAASEPLAEDTKPEIKAPLTTGFARTGYELQAIEAREQKMSYSKAESAEAVPSK
jgi:Na+-transporting methylmalonyl-CoA/oxaloacetate decarboxylase gamma subunit